MQSGTNGWDIPDALTVLRIYLNLVRGKTVPVLADAELDVLALHAVRLLLLVIQLLLLDKLTDDATIQGHQGKMDPLSL